MTGSPWPGGVLLSGADAVSGLKEVAEFMGEDELIPGGEVILDHEDSEPVHVDRIEIHPVRLVVERTGLADEEDG